jgi:hypothetical protein
MKKIALLSLASLALTAVTSQAAVQNDDTVVQLPTYRVESPRYLTAEQQVEASLAALRAAATAPRTMRVELPALGTSVVTPASRTEAMASQTPAPQTGRRS